MIRMGGFVIKKIPPFNSPLPIWSFLVLAAINKQYNNNNNNNQKTFLSNLTNLRQLISTFHSQPSNQQKKTHNQIPIHHDKTLCSIVVIFATILYLCIFVFVASFLVFVR